MADIAANSAIIPATGAMGPTPVKIEALYILLIISGAPGTQPLCTESA